MESYKKAIMAVLVIAVVGVGVFALSGSDDAESNNSASTNSKTDELPFAFNVNALAPLEKGLYEGWIVSGETKTSFGTFNTNDSGSIVGELAYEGADVVNGDMVVVTIEPVPDTDSEPSGVVVIAGEVSDSSAELSFPVDVSGFSGGYILATPTNGDDTNETAGVWYLDPSGPSASLDIPVAPDGWVYEGWVVSNGTPITTGRFADPAMADSFDGYSGNKAGPPFPGEDLIRNLPDGLSGPLAIDDGNSMVVISIEPDINGQDPTGAGPAQVKPLSARVAKDSADHTLFDLDLNTEVPSGSASF